MSDSSTLEQLSSKPTISLILSVVDLSNQTNLLKEFNEYDIAEELQTDPQIVNSQLQIINDFISVHNINDTVEKGVAKANTIAPTQQFQMPNVIFVYAGSRTNARTLEGFKERSCVINLGNLFRSIFEKLTNGEDVTDEDYAKVLTDIESLTAHETTHLFIKQLFPDHDHSFNSVTWEEGLATHIETQHMRWHIDFVQLAKYLPVEFATILGKAEQNEKFSALAKIISHPLYRKWFDHIRDEIEPLIQAHTDLNQAITKALIKSNGPLYHLGYLLWQYELRTSGLTLEQLVAKGHQALPKWLIDYVQNPPQKELSPLVTTITQYARQGYLFHGSPNPHIEILEPRQANDTNPSRKFNMDKAVYASPDPVASIIFSIMNFPPNTPHEIMKGHWSVGQNEEGIIAKITKKWEPYLRANKGNLYILPQETFTEYAGWQAKSLQAVTPATKLIVTLQDYEDLGGQIEWTTD